MRRLFVRWLIHVLSLGIASQVVAGVYFPGDPPGVGQVLLVAGVFGLLNAMVKPMMQLMACGLYVATLGLIHFVINALVLQLTGWLAAGLLVVDGFWAAFQGALVISVVGTLLTWLLDPEEAPVVQVAHGHAPRGRGDVIDGD